MQNRNIDEEMHIVYASDDNFAEIMGISILSLLENNQNVERITIYILSSAISNKNKERIETVCKRYGRQSPVWIPATNINDELKIEVKQDRGSVSQFARLFISSVLPKNLERVLYLDCDTIINNSLKELWNMDLQGKTIAALLDSFSPMYRKNLGLEKNDILFNSAVMLIDFKKWKSGNIEGKILNLIKKYNGLIPQGDQGALGAILSNETVIFNPKFNVITLYYDFSYDNMIIYRKPPFYYTKDEVTLAIGNPTIVHFTTSFLSKRVWIEGSEHPFAKKWLEYKDMSPWKNEPLRKFKVKTWKKLYVQLYKLLPLYFSVRISGILQAYGRPFFEKIKYRIH